jgi:oxygen-independent coproporphyrinogen III oxidase
MAGIYLHVPFCRQACVYCNFHFSTSLKQVDSVVAAMMREIALKKHRLGGEIPETVYIGGGTPSLLPPATITKIWDAIQTAFPNIELSEFTLEANPDDLTPTYLKALRQTPVNRLSIGIQSFREADLKFMNRAHNAEQALSAIQNARDAGFENITADLIYGLPDMPLAAWQANLDQLLNLGLPHFSAYALTVEPKTALHHAVTQRKAPPTDPEHQAQAFLLLAERAAAAGYEQYEISNFAQPGKYAVHNTAYWSGKKYIGIGPSAHSFDGDTRSWNIANNALYTASILNRGVAEETVECLTARDRTNEYIMTALRTMWGMDLEIAETLSGGGAKSEMERSAARYLAAGQLLRSGNVLTLTTEGKLFADGIAADLFMD